MANESVKSLRRRYVEDFKGEIPWMKYLSGKILDIGAGTNPLPLQGVTPFDNDGTPGNVSGDANRISEYFPVDSFDCVYSSQCLEHMICPRTALQEWLKVLKPGGYLVATIPDIGAYERFNYPSPYNSDHKSSWSTIYRGSKFPIHCYLPEFLKQFEGECEIVLCRYVERNFNWAETDRDQTWLENEGVEIWNEFVLQKKLLDTSPDIVDSPGKCLV